MNGNIPQTFKGLSLEPVDAFKNISLMIEVGLLMAVSDLEDSSDLGDCILSQAKLYAEAAQRAAREGLK